MTVLSSLSRVLTFLLKRVGEIGKKLKLDWMTVGVRNCKLYNKYCHQKRVTQRVPLNYYCRYQNVCFGPVVADKPISLLTCLVNFYSFVNGKFLPWMSCSHFFLLSFSILLYFNWKCFFYNSCFCVSTQLTVYDGAYFRKCND